LYVTFGDGTRFSESVPAYKALLARDGGQPGIGPWMAQANPRERAPFNGKILRLDPVTLRWSIFATGLRQPWRSAFEPGSDGLWVGDVGQNAWEEINFVRRGDNLGEQLAR
jgi:glucose/arabinose dehydrogenase